MIRLLLSATLIVGCSAQVCQTTPAVYTPNEILFTGRLPSSANGFPKSTALSGLPGMGSNTVVIFVMIPPGTATTAAVSEALSQILRDGRTTSSQTWQVPVIQNLALRKDILAAELSPIGWAQDQSDSRSTITVPIPISDVAGLQQALSSINSSISSLTATVANLNTTVNTLSSTVQSLPPIPTFVDSETPVGATDGSNITFTLSGAPSPLSSLALRKNGMIMNQGSDYSVSGVTILFSKPATPLPGDNLVAAYRR